MVVGKQAGNSFYLLLLPTKKYLLLTNLPNLACLLQPLAYSSMLAVSSEEDSVICLLRPVRWKC